MFIVICQAIRWTHIDFNDVLWLFVVGSSNFI
jgi:hypothetical protein